MITSPGQTGHGSRWGLPISGNDLKKRTKRTFALHHWCGLIAGIFILAISLSGAVLVFHDDIDAAIYAEESQLSTPARALHIDSSFEWVRQENPGWDIRIMALPDAPDEALLYELRQGQLRQWLFVHPETGEKLATVPQAHNRLVYILLNLHYNLLAGTAGKIAVLLTGVALLLLTVTGFMLYRKSVLKVITFRQTISRKSRRNLFSSLHRVVGVWALVFNLLMCVTGISLAITVVNAALKGSTAAIQVPAVPISIDAAMQEIEATYPGFEVTYLRFPVSDEGKLQLRGRFKTDPAYYGAIYSTVQVNYKTGEIESADFLREHPWHERLLTILHPLHFGDYAGTIVKILYSTGGLMPGILSITGFLLWRYRRKQPPVKRQPAKSSKAIG